MQSLFQPEGVAALSSRIGALRPDSAAHWGKMNVQEMLTHCNLGMDVSLGKLQLRRAMVGRLFGWLGKRMVLGNEKPFSKNMPTDPSLLKPAPEVDAAAVEAQKAQLIEAVTAFQKGGPTSVPTGPHPFFGKLRADEWDSLAAKHLDHHLRQFGC